MKLQLLAFLYRRGWGLSVFDLIYGVKGVGWVASGLWDLKGKK